MTKSKDKWSFDYILLHLSESQIRATFFTLQLVLIVQTVLGETYT